MPFPLGSVVTVACAALAAAFFLLLAARWRRLREGTWGDWVAVAALLVLAPFAVRSARHAGAWLLLAPVAASRLFGDDFRFRRSPATAGADRPALNAFILVIFGAAALAGIARLWTLPLPRLGWRPVPEGALAAVRACPDPLYNHYDQGGYLIWFVPERRVFIDNRLDPYPQSLLLEHQAVEAGAASPDALFARYAVGCSFLPATSPTVAALERAGWRTTFRDRDWVVQAQR
jgi:hypothetical protein